MPITYEANLGGGLLFRKDVEHGAQQQLTGGTPLASSRLSLPFLCRGPPCRGGREARALHEPVGPTQEARPGPARQHRRRGDCVRRGRLVGRSGRAPRCVGLREVARPRRGGCRDIARPQEHPHAH